MTDPLRASHSESVGTPHTPGPSHHTPQPTPRLGETPAVLDILHVDPTARVDLESLTVGMALAFAGGVAGGLFADALDRAAHCPSTWEPKRFAKDLFLEEFVGCCFRIRAGGRTSLVSKRHLLRVLMHAPSDPRVTDFRRLVLKELADSAEHRRRFESIYADLCRFQVVLEGATMGKKWDANRRQLDILAIVKSVIDTMADSFEGAGSGLARIRAFGAAVRAGEGYRSMADLLDFDDDLATVHLKVRVGADGRVRDFQVLDVRENDKNAFVVPPARRWLTKLELFVRGYRFGDGEIMARLLDAIFEGLQSDLAKLVQLLGDMEVYLGALGFGDMAAAAGLEVCLPELRRAGAVAGANEPERALLGLFNPLLLAAGAPVVPCDLMTDRAGTTVLITGPNSGGKTRVLQSLGLAQLLAQAGLFVPARAARVTAVSGLVVSLIQEITADQTEGRLGTELVRIRSLFEELRPGSMVILDELCSGTNPSEGEEIFEVVVSVLTRLRPQAFITTHFLSFAARLEQERAIADLRFLQVELDPAQRPTFQFVPGVARTSLAGQAAARLGVTLEQLVALADASTRRGAGGS